MSFVYQILDDGDEPLFSDIEGLLPEQLSSVPLTESLLLVDLRDPDQAGQLIDRVRTQIDPNVYLRPIIGLHDGASSARMKLLGVDELCSIASFTDSKRNALHSHFTAANRWIDSLKSGEDTNVTFRMLRHMVSRDAEQKPQPTTSCQNGFLYPQLQHYLGHHREGALQALEFLQSQQLIRGDFEARAHFCIHCDCAFLNFQEACPHCRSNNLRVDDMVHHFRCAHTAALSDFKQNGQLICPKCDRELKHIGVDYDKPSTVYNCNPCNHRFQEPTVLATCYNCARTTEPENQRVRTLYTFEATALGENAARYGLETLFTSLLGKDMTLHSYDTFSTLVNVEAARIARYKRSESSLLAVRILNLDEIYIKLGARAASFFAEISAVFKSVLRQSDVITARNESIFLILLLETDTERAERVVERLQQGVSELLVENLGQPVEFQTRVEPINADLDPSVLLEQMLGAAELDASILLEQMQGNADFDPTALPEKVLSADAD